MIFIRLVVALVLVFPAVAAVDEEAGRVFDGIAGTLTNARTAEVDLRLNVKTPTAPQGEGDLAADYKLSIDRPARMSLALQSGNLGATVISDGTNVVTFLPKPGVYTIEKSSGKIGGVDGGAGDMGSMAFITALFSTNVRTALLAGVLEAKYGGREKVGEVECERIDLKQEGLNWRLFATPGTNALVRRIEVAIPQLSMSMDFTNWKLNGPIPGDRFVFVPPAGARKVENLLEEEKEGEESGLIGQQLPALKLKTVENQSFDTGSLKGKAQIVVIWAGETEHCAGALKAAATLAGARKNIGVLSVNVDEKPDRAKIKTFLSKEKITVKTVLDEAGEAIDKWEVEGVPLTFLLDKAGVMRKAFLGYHAEFRGVVGKELDALN